jgi:hypothetical protein
VVDDRVVATSHVTHGIGKLILPVDREGATIVFIDLKADGAITPGLSLDLIGIELVTDPRSSSSAPGQ